MAVKREEWTGEAIALMHINDIKQYDLAKKIGWSNAYLCMVLNGNKKPVGARERIMNAIGEMLNDSVEG